MANFRKICLINKKYVLNNYKIQKYDELNAKLINKKIIYI